MKTVPLHGKKAAGRVALVDDGDYELVMQYRWNVYEAYRRGRHDGPYALANAKRDGKWTKIKMHALIMGRAGVDHRDHDGLNNQRANLRLANQSQNAWNGRPKRGSSSGFRGVSWDRARSKWHAQISVNRKPRNLGRFALEDDAARAYDAAAREARGDFAYLNFPDMRTELT